MPGLKGVSENIKVKRLVDRYLEHTRLFIFGSGDNTKVIMGSADLMNRNLNHRIEVCVPIKSRKLRNELIDYFEIQWNDNDKAVELTSNLDQQKNDTGNKEIVNAQQSIYQYLQDK
jgi:polyphosphate kinase